MLRTTAGVLACSLSLLVIPDAGAQSRKVQSDLVSASVTVVSTEQASRTLTFRDSKGDHHTVKVPEGVALFSELKPGDTVTAKYYDNFTLTMKQPGEPDVNTLRGAATGTTGTAGGAAVAQRRITATIDNIDMDVPSISFKGPDGWSYSTKVKDKDAIENVKVGDRVDITWTESVLVDVSR